MVPQAAAGTVAGKASRQYLQGKLKRPAVTARTCRCDATRSEPPPGPPVSKWTFAPYSPEPCGPGFWKLDRLVSSPAGFLTGRPRSVRSAVLPGNPEHPFANRRALSRLADGPRPAWPPVSQYLEAS